MSRGNESAMEFEYENKTGPVDGRSPFMQYSQNPGAFRGFGTATPSKKRMKDPRSGPNVAGTDSMTESASAFSSPYKSTTNHQSSPTRKPLPPVPAFNALYNTPRSKSNNDYDDSSAGETPKSPEHTDNDATPDHSNMGLRNRLNPWAPSAVLPAQGGAERERNSPTKDRERPQNVRRDSLLEKLGGKIRRAVYSPGRGEISRPEHSGAVEKRVKKRRERDLQRQVSRRRRHSMSDSGEDSELHLHKSPRKTSGKHRRKDGDDGGEKQQQHWLSAMFTFIAQHPTVPHILSFYAQLVFNVFLLAACVYMIYCFWSAVQGDVDKKSHEAMADIMAEMAECARQYTANNCEPERRAPALQTVCEGWHKCMNRDASKVGRAKVSAHTFAEIFNSFVEPISWKAMIFTCVLVFGAFATGNLAFGIFRDKTQQYQPTNYYQAPPPPTPQRSFSGQDGAQQYFGTPWDRPQMLEPGPSAFPQQGQIEGRGSPVRRLVYN